MNEKGKGKFESNSHSGVEQEEPVNKGKGKRWETEEEHRNSKRLCMMPGMSRMSDYPAHFKHPLSEDAKIKQEDMGGTIAAPYATCGICMDAFQPTYSPYTASLSANSSSRLQFGLRLPCPQQHAYCVGCLTSYIESKLDPDGKGSGNTGIIVFPIRCPECPITDFMDGIADEIAARVLGPEKMVLWVRSQRTCLNFICSIYRRDGSRITRSY